MLVLGKRNFQGQEFTRVGVQSFPYELWLDSQGRLCRFLHCAGINFAIIDGEGTFVSGPNFSGSVLKDGYNFETGEVKTNMGNIKVRFPDFLHDVKMFEDIIFFGKYDKSKDPYL